MSKLTIQTILLLSILIFVNIGCTEKQQEPKTVTKEVVKKKAKKKPAKKTSGLVKTPAYKSLEKAKQSTKFVVGKINEHKISGKEPKVMPINGNMLSITGWAIDQLRNSTAGGVYIEFDGKQQIAAKYGKNKPSVGKYLKNAKYNKSGFILEIPTSKLGKGKHTFKVKVVSKNKKVYYDSDKLYEINIR